MSLVSFAAANLTTRDDRRRRPAVSPGQVARTLAFLAAAVLALAVMARSQGHAADAPSGMVGSVGVTVAR